MVKISTIVMWIILAFVFCLIVSLINGETIHEFIERFTFVGFFNLMVLTVLSYFKIL